MLALVRRTETWAFAAALGADLAVSMLLWGLPDGGEGLWWVWVLQANVVSTAVVTLLWLVILVLMVWNT